MTYKQALKLKVGDKIVRKSTNNIFTIEKIHNSCEWCSGNELLSIICRDEKSNTYNFNHKDIRGKVEVEE